MTPDDYMRMQAINNMGLSYSLGDAGRALGYAALPAAVYGANALAGGSDERLDRTLINTAGNLAGMALGKRFGIPAAVVGGLVGGYASDRIADQFDENDGRVAPKQDPMQLLNQHLSQLNPYEQEAILRQQMMQAKQAQREQQRAMQQAAMQRYQMN